MATGIGAAAGAGLLGAAGVAGTATVAGLSLGTIATIASVATVVGAVASLGAALTAKKPSARGSVTDVTIAVDPPQPYMMGRTYSAGVLRHDAGYGPEIDKVKNPYLGKVLVYSGSGPIEQIESRQFDYQNIDFSNPAGWYFGWVGAPGQLGQKPEAAGLVPPFAGLPDWGSDYRLNGQAAVLWNFKFDKKAKRYASGIPPYGIIAKGVKVYDPRKDSTYPGGSGAHRITDENTWEYSENPGLHAIAYTYGRHQNGKKVFGVGLPIEGIDIAAFVSLANVCDVNDWKVGGTIFEPADRWENMKDILAAGGAEPIFAGGKITCRVRAPKVALETIFEGDLADGDMEVTTAQSYRDRLNGVVPKYRSEAHNWQYVSSETVSVPEYVAEDGEEKVQERQFNLVQQGKQAAQLAAYELVDGREMGPIVLNLKPYWRRYLPGDCLHLYLPSMEIDHDAVILTREFDPGSLTVTLTLITETAGKHAFALGQVPHPPPTPTLTDPADRDDALADEYVAHLPNLTDTTGELLPNVVDTPAIVGGAVTANTVVIVPNTAVSASSTVTLFTTGMITVGDLEYTSALANVNFTMNAAIAGQYDASARFSLYIDEGSGFVLSKQQTLGVTTGSGNTTSRVGGMLQALIGTPTFAVRLDATSGAFMPASVSRNIIIEDITLSVFGAKR